MVLLGLKTHFLKIFLCYFGPPPLPMQKNWVKLVPKLVFITFSNFGCKISTVTVQAKSTQKWHFLGKKPISKKFSQVILVPQPKLCEKIGSKWPLNGFLQGGALKAPPLVDIDFRGPLRQGEALREQAILTVQGKHVKSLH